MHFENSHYWIVHSNLEHINDWKLKIYCNAQNVKIYHNLSEHLDMFTQQRFFTNSSDLITEDWQNLLYLSSSTNVNIFTYNPCRG